ncbi:hypothetical protein SprV_0100259900 [Sparganum proliferum]
MLWAGLREETVVVVVTDSIGTQNLPPGCVVCPDAGIEIAKNDQLVHLRHSRRERVEIFVELVFASSKLAIGRERRQWSNDGFLDGHGDASDASVCLWTAAPIEVVAGSHLLQLALFGEADLAESSDIHLEARRFPNDQHRPFLLPAAPRIV